MDESKKSNLTKKHFSKIHERIQNKYAQMQMRIEKSRSMESISNLGEEFATEKWSVSMKSLDNNEEDEVFSGKMIDKDDDKYSMIVEDVNRHDSVAEDCEEIMLYESKISSAMQEDDDYEFLENDVIFDKELQESTEHELNEETVSSTAARRITVRERILAARKRRKEKRNMKKEKLKRRSLDSIDNTDKLILTNKPVDASKRRNKLATVSVALVEATGPTNETALDEIARQVYCRIRLGQEKYKSKPVKINENLASWQELFNFSLFEHTLLEITMWEKERDVLVGRTVVDLSELKHNKTHRMNLPLETDVPVEILILVTISGTQDDTVDCETRQNEIMKIKKNVSWMLLNDDFDYVGMLHMTVYRAKGLHTSDCFAVVILGNDRNQTHTEHKTHNPVWMKMFTFEVKDATLNLDITIYDEKKSEIVGRLAIPLMRIRNGEQKWYALKDKTCRERAKGQNPRILLEMNVYFNVFKQSIRLINPKERILLPVEPEFSRKRLSTNIARVRTVIDWATAASKLTKTLFEWESKRLNVVALSGWLVFWYFYEPWMLPLLLLFPYFWYRPEKYHFTRWKPDVMWKPLDLSRVESRTSTGSMSTLTGSREGSKTSFRQKLNSVTDMVTTVQNEIGNVASLGESVKNLFNFTVPFISFFSIMGILVASIILYYIQSRYLIMAWGVHKFLRKILRPNRIPNNEVLDLLSRVPDDEVLLDCNELPLLPTEENILTNKTTSKIKES